VVIVDGRGQGSWPRRAPGSSWSSTFAAMPTRLGLRAMHPRR